MPRHARAAAVEPAEAGRPLPRLHAGEGGRGGAPAYAELLAASNFSFLRSASHPEELSAAAAILGLSGLAVADRNTLAGVVRGHLAAKQTGVPFAVGCRLVFADATPDIAVWAPDRAAYGRLCRLLTAGNLRGEKGDCRLFRQDLLDWGAGLQLALSCQAMSRQPIWRRLCKASGRRFPAMFGSAPAPSTTATTAAASPSWRRSQAASACRSSRSATRSTTRPTAAPCRTS